MVGVGADLRGGCMVASVGTHGPRAEPILKLYLQFLLLDLREFCGKSDAAFGGCGFFCGCAPPKRVIPGSVRDLW